MSTLDTVTYIETNPIDSDSKYAQHTIVASVMFDHFTNEYFAEIRVIGDNEFTGVTSLGHDYLAINETAIHDALAKITGCLTNEEEHHVIDFVANALAEVYTDILPT